jgi:small subunit ribosomal protein S21
LLLPPGGARDISDLCVVAHTRRCCFLSRNPARRGWGLRHFRLGFFGLAQYVLPLSVATAKQKEECRMPLRMRVHDREPIGLALRRFKKLLERSGIQKELRKRKYYEKPCEARRRKEARRKNAIRKAASMPRT